MAVDDDGPLGHSAVSTGGGETLRLGTVSPGTERPEPGEFMVRLKLDVPDEARPQIEMRDGHRYVWVRAWEDGYHGGHFRLAWDGAAFFDSRSRCVRCSTTCTSIPAPTKTGRSRTSWFRFMFGS